MDTNFKAESLSASQSKPNNETWEAPLVFGFLFLLVLCLIFWPWTYGLINSLWANKDYEDLGTVQSINYVGFGPHTQVNTETQTFLLRGTLILTKGTRLERRRGLLDSEVCIVKSVDDCWHLMGS